MPAKKISPLTFFADIRGAVRAAQRRVVLARFELKVTPRTNFKRRKYCALRPIKNNFAACLVLLFLICSDYASADSAVVASTINGERLYSKLCVQCHGVKGVPEPAASSLLVPPPGDLTAAEYQYGSSREDIIEVIRSGSGTNMMHYQKRLSSEQIAAIADYVLKLKAAGNK